MQIGSNCQKAGAPSHKLCNNTNLWQLVKNIAKIEVGD